MNRKRRRTHSPPGTGGVTRRAGVVVKSKWFSLIPMNKWGGELFDPSTTPALRATPPVPGGELFLPLLQFIHTFTDRAFYVDLFHAIHQNRDRIWYFWVFWTAVGLSPVSPH